MTMPATNPPASTLPVLIAIHPPFWQLPVWCLLIALVAAAAAAPAGRAVWRDDVLFVLTLFQPLIDVLLHLQSRHAVLEPVGRRRRFEIVIEEFFHALGVILLMRRALESVIFSRTFERTDSPAQSPPAAAA